MTGIPFPERAQWSKSHFNTISFTMANGALRERRDSNLSPAQKFEDYKA
jgi:hypothetical protein